MKKILIMDDIDKFLKRMQDNITKFHVLVTKTMEGAIEILESEDISFFVVDRDLGYEKEGEKVYDLIFARGKSIPAMILSANPISSQTRKELFEMGFSSIRIKNDPEKRSSEVIEEEAIRILGSYIERIKQTKKNVEKLEIGAWPLLFNEKRSIDDWIKSIEGGKHTDDDLEKLKALIIDACKAERRRRDDYEFDAMA